MQSPVNFAFVFKMKPSLSPCWVHDQVLHAVSLRIFTHMELYWFTALAFSLLNPVLGPDPRLRSDFSSSVSPFTQIAAEQPPCERAAPCSAQRPTKTMDLGGGTGVMDAQWEFPAWDFDI